MYEEDWLMLLGVKKYFMLMSPQEGEAEQDRLIILRFEKVLFTPKIHIS